jgi:hypothetical protein
LIIAAMLAFGVSASSMPVFDAGKAIKVKPFNTAAAFKTSDEQVRKRWRGPCVKGDRYDKKQRSCQGADSKPYARGDRAAGRCKPGDRFSGKYKNCRTKDKKTYKPSKSFASSFAESKKSVKDRRMKRGAALAKKHGCNAGDGWNRRRKMCVHYYKGKK